MICNQLGYADGGVKYNAGAGRGNIVAGNRKCEGHESNIFECRAYRGDTHDCLHGLDQGVQCHGPRNGECSASHTH